MAEDSGANTTRLLDGRLILRQPATGHRVGTDAVLLAAAAPEDAGPDLVDVGAGVGAVGLAVAARAPGIAVHLVEADAASASLAGQNADLNGFASRVQVHVADIFDPDACAALRHRMHTALSNPPFYPANQVRASRDHDRARAHVFPGGPKGHGDWLRALMRFLPPHGIAVLIHRPDALPALLAAAENRLGTVSVRPIHARAGEPAIRILFGGVAGSRSPLRLLAPLVLHGPDGRFTDEAEALHRGQALLPCLERKSRPRRPAFSKVV